MTDAAVPVAIYARYSTDRQDARSIDDQVRRCRAYAASRGYEVIVEYKDAAISGAHVQRVDMQRLLSAARAGGAGSFRVVLVDDLSRLSRDLGNTWQIVFHDLASADVKVIDVTTGMSSDGAGARLTFGAMALVNDTFLQLVRTETHRGLEGRALAGFWTGGRCYGYATVQEESPPDPTHPRKSVIVQPEEAALVLRVFQLFADGTSLKRIAATLNEDGISAPNDGGRGNKHGRGWGHTTIRAMLSNERYLGRFTWNQSKWVRVSGRKSRKRVMRPESEWITHEQPELAIIPSDLWSQVQGRLRRVYTLAAGRPPGTGRHVHLVSGLLRCGVCGGSMTVIGRKAKNGVSYARFGCTTHYSRGATICANALSVSEKKASGTLVKALRARFGQPEHFSRFVSIFTDRASALRRADNKDPSDLDRRIRDGERRLANLTEALAKVGWSEVLAAKLKEEESQLARLNGIRRRRARHDHDGDLRRPGPAADVRDVDVHVYRGRGAPDQDGYDHWSGHDVHVRRARKLTEVDLPDGRVVEYVIDEDQRRVGKKINGVMQKQWLYDDGTRTAAELDGAVNVLSTFIYGCGGYFSRPPQDRSGIRHAQALNGVARSTRSRS